MVVMKVAALVGRFHQPSPRVFGVRHRRPGLGGTELCKLQAVGECPGLGFFERQEGLTARACEPPLLREDSRSVCGRQDCVKPGTIEKTGTWPGITELHM